MCDSRAQPLAWARFLLWVEHIESPSPRALEVDPRFEADKLCARGAKTEGVWARSQVLPGLWARGPTRNAPGPPTPQARYRGGGATGAVETAGPGEKTPRSTLLSRPDLPISLGAPALSSGTAFQLQRTSLPPGLAPRRRSDSQGFLEWFPVFPPASAWGGLASFVFFFGGGVGRWQSPRRDCARPAAREAPRATSVNATPPARPWPRPGRRAPAREACAASAASARGRGMDVGGGIRA